MGVCLQAAKALAAARRCASVTPAAALLSKSCDGFLSLTPSSVTAYSVLSLTPSSCTASVPARVREASAVSSHSAQPRTSPPTRWSSGLSCFLGASHTGGGFVSIVG